MRYQLEIHVLPEKGEDHTVLLDVPHWQGPIRQIDPADLRTLTNVVEDMEGVAELLIDKRRDYGSANIRMTGPVGIAVRLVDKSARLWNLLSQGKTPNNETMEDTWRDVIGYGTIGLQLHRRGEW